MIGEKKRLAELLRISHEMSQMKDIDLLLESLLTEARRLANADAGSIYIREADHLKFSYTQNDTLQAKLPSGKKMIYSTFAIPMDSRSIAGHSAFTGSILNIPDAYNIAKDVPYSFQRQYDDISGYRTRSILTAPIKNVKGVVVGVIQLINARDGRGNFIPFTKEDELFVTHFADNAATAIERAQLTRSMILRMISMAELRDPKETGGHVNRVASYAVEIYEEWARNKKGASAAEIQGNKDILRMAAMLHDVGKIAIADAILKKPARLDDNEVIIMRQHTFLGARLFKDNFSEIDEASMSVALNHHERWDGTGYPGHVDVMTGKPLPGFEMPDGRARGKKAEETPAFGRIVAIADVYDALSCRRSYKEPWDEGRVFEQLKMDTGTQFDAEMIDSFFNVIDVIRSIASRYPG